MSAKLPPPDLPPPNKFSRIPVLILHLHLHLRPTSPSAKTIMSDEYASSGFKGSLVNPCTRSRPHNIAHLTRPHLSFPYSIAINDIMPSRQRESYSLYSDYATKNYPPPGDSTFLPLVTPIGARSRAFTLVSSFKLHLQAADAQVPPTAPALPDRRSSSRSRRAPSHRAAASSIVMLRASTRAKRRPTRSPLGIALLASGWAEWANDG